MATTRTDRGGGVGAGQTSSADRRQGVNSGAAIKVPCRAASTAALVLSGEQTVDDVALVAGDRCLVKDQADGTTIGIYEVDTGVWTRTEDWNGSYDVKRGTLVYVTGGTLNAGFWAVTTADPITPGTTSVTIQRARMQQEVLPVACSDEITPLIAISPAVTLRMPYAMSLTSVKASLTNAQTAGTILTINVKKNGVTILSTKITIDNNEKTSKTAATPPVLSDTALAEDDEITIHIDQIGNGTAAGLKVYLIGLQPNA